MKATWPLSFLVLSFLILSFLIVGCTEDTRLSGPQTAPAPHGAPAALPQITFGPQPLGLWGPDGWFNWAADPAALEYEWAMSSYYEYAADTGDTTPNSIGALIAWLDSATVHPGTLDPMWVATPDTTVEFTGLEETATNQNKWVFAVRSVYEGGQRAPLEIPVNLRIFDTQDSLPGPYIQILSNLGQCHDTFSSLDPSTLIDPALRFEWRTPYPGPSGLPAVITEWKIDDAAEWTLSGNASYPESELDRWVPTAGPHTFSVRATDIANFQSTLDYHFVVVPADGRGILVVQDTGPAGLSGITPPDFATIEASAIETWLSSYVYELHSTGGTAPPSGEQLARASTVIWVLGTNTYQGDEAVLWNAMARPSSGDEAFRFLPTLTSWQRTGGNLILCGFGPSNAIRYVQTTDCYTDFMHPYPLDFEATDTDPNFFRHFALDAFELAQVGGFVEWPYESADRLHEATSQRPGYPDLHFDPLRWPGGPAFGGFGHYDFDLAPYANAEILYTRNGEASGIAVANLNGPGRRGSGVYLGLHPYFLQTADVVAFFDRVLSDFGELRVKSHLVRD